MVTSLEILKLLKRKWEYYKQLWNNKYLNLDETVERLLNHSLPKMIQEEFKNLNIYYSNWISN